jgi:hypothetical protein
VVLENGGPSATPRMCLFGRGLSAQAIRVLVLVLAAQ